MSGPRHGPRGIIQSIAARPPFYVVIIEPRGIIRRSPSRPFQVVVGGRSYQVYWKGYEALDTVASSGLGVSL